MDFLKHAIRFIFGLIAPVLLIAAGVGIVGWGLSSDTQFLLWVGFSLIGAGVIWGIVVYGTLDWS